MVARLMVPTKKRGVPAERLFPCQGMTNSKVYRRRIANAMAHRRTGRRDGEFRVKRERRAGSLLLAVRSEDRGHPASFHTRRLVDLGDVLELLDEAPQQVHPLVLVDDVATAELDPGLHLVVVFEKSSGMPRFELEIVRVGVRPEADFLELDVLRLLARLFFLLLLLVAVLSVIDDLAYRRSGRRRDLYEVQLVLAGSLQRFFDVDDVVFAVGLDDANLLRPDLFVYAYFVCDSSFTFSSTSGRETVPRERGVNCHASAVVWFPGRGHRSVRAPR